MAQADGTLFNAVTTGSKIVGTIVADKDVRIDGFLDGELKCDGRVVVSETGSIKGTLNCKNAEIMGKIEGNVIAEAVALHANCEVKGEMKMKTLTVEPSAVFNGTCIMGTEQPKAEQPKAQPQQQSPQNQQTHLAHEFIWK